MTSRRHTLQLIAAAAGAEDGAVDAAALPALDATHWTTAAAALMARANGGVIPDTPQALTAARAAVDPQVQLNLATSVRLVADAGVPLPEGSADTLALLLDEAATNAFIEAQPDFATVRAEVAAEPQPTQRVALVVDSPRRLMFALANPVQGGGGIVDLNPDGTALLHDTNGTGAGRWAWLDGQLTVTLDSPIVQESFPSWTDPATGVSQQLRAEFRTQGLRARLIGGDWAALVGIVGAVVVGLFAAFGMGRKSGADKERDAASRDYQETRKEIDNADLGLGADDSGRIDRLRAIADRRSAGKD